MRKLFILTLFLLPALCPSHETDSLPELWSWFKPLKKSAEACSIQSTFALEHMGVKNVTTNKYGVYGVYRNNRVVVKCLEQGPKSIVWVAVAGNDRDSVELLRNHIVKAIK